MVSSKWRSSSVYDSVRNKWVVAQPEERVRQTLLQKMIVELGFPKGHIAVEFSLKELPHLTSSSLSLPKRRADIIVFAKGIHPNYPLYPLLLIECKAEELSESALEQLKGYNYYVNAPYIALASKQGIRVSFMHQVLSYLPSYQALVDGLIS